jgi:hypothetical protein
MSIFTEVGLVDENRIREERSAVRTHGETLGRLRPAKMLRFRSRNDIFNDRGEKLDDDEDDWESVCDEDDANDSLPAVTVPALSFMPAKLHRLGLLSVLLALMLPIMQLNPLKHVGVRGGAIPTNSIKANAERSTLVIRDDSSTDACRRFSGASAVVNGTLYMYGFRKMSKQQQKDNTWSRLIRSLMPSFFLPFVNANFLKRTTSSPSISPTPGRSARPP